MEKLSYTVKVNHQTSFCNPKHPRPTLDTPNQIWNTFFDMRYTKPLAAINLN